MYIYSLTTALCVDPTRKRIEHTFVPSVVHNRLLIFRSELRGVFLFVCFLPPREFGFLFILYLLGLQRASRALRRLFVEFNLNCKQEAKMRFAACLLPRLQPRNALRCISGVNIDGTHSIVGYTSPSLPSFPFAEVCALQPAPPLSSPPFLVPSPPPPPFLSHRSCAGKFESGNWELTFEPVR